jgi:integrase
MAKVNVRKETGKLVIDFTYRGVRCREQTALDEGAANRKRVEAVLKKLREAIAAGTFVYGEFFPGSALAARFDSLPASHLGAAASKPQTEVAAAAATAVAGTPIFRDFVTTWLAEHKVEWRRSHIKVLNSTLNGHLLPAFGDKPVGTITKSDVFAFRAKLA